MKQHSEIKMSYFFSMRTLTILSVIFFVMVVMATTFKNHSTDKPIPSEKINEDSVESVKAFAGVYQVLMSPRCLNCHPAGDVPLQGDDSHAHAMSPQRGIDGTGVYAMKCKNCHQDTNTEGLHSPPGNPVWHLPPADMKMVFEGKTAHELAKQLLDPEQNGNKTLEELKEHASDTLVVWGWQPGEGRTLPPLSYEAFKEAWYTWIDKGAYAPQAE